MPYYRAVGTIPPKRHTQHRAEDGTLYYEELMAQLRRAIESRTLEDFVAGFYDVRQHGARDEG